MAFESISLVCIDKTRKGNLFRRSRFNKHISGGLC